MLNISGVPRRPVLLIILDGFGTNPSKYNNAVAEANTPNLDCYISRYPHTLLNASGHAVGLPDGQMGNSEVGHLTLGTGAILRQDIVRINDAIHSGEFFRNRALLAAIDHAKRHNRPVHLFGLVSDGGVHSHLNHLLALLELCKQQDVRPLLHMITDGRDTAPHSSLQYLPQVNSAIQEAGGAIASIMGRYYALDRDKRWDRNERAWRTLLYGKTTKVISAEAAIRTAWADGQSDEFIHPVMLSPNAAIQHDDALICFNFRKDRPRQILAALGTEDFSGFDRGRAPLARVTGMTRYDPQQPFPYAFESEQAATTLGQVISTLGLAQFHCAETEKYPHVTWFFNGGRAEPYSGESQLLVPSPRVATYDLMPGMSAAAVANATIGAMNRGRYAFIVVNFANGDMVGHTAIRPAILKAVETLDQEVGRLLDAATTIGYSVVLTADHGNCEEMVDPLSGEPHTQHTTYPVPCMVMDEYHWQLSSSAGLSNVAPTILQLMGIPQPREMPATSLLLKRLTKASHDRRRPSQRLRGAA